MTVPVLDNRFDQNESEIRLHWPLTGKATLDLRAARIERTHAHFSERDFAGPVGAVSLYLKITDKTSLTASLGRELSSYQSLASSAISTDRLVISPSWQIGMKTALRARYDYARRDFQGAITASPLNDRFDTQHSAMLALEWQPVLTLPSTPRCRTTGARRTFPATTMTARWLPFRPNSLFSKGKSCAYLVCRPG